MNKIYRVVWNAVRGCCTAASEATGSAQARGRDAAAVVLAATALAAGTASAAIVDVITAEGTKTDVMIYAGVVDNEGNIAELNRLADEFTIFKDDVKATGIDSSVENVHVTQGKTLTLTGSSGSKAALFVWNGYMGTQGHFEHGVINIGSATAVQTTGRYENIYVGAMKTDPSEFYNTDDGRAYLLIDNADIEIGYLHAAARVDVKAGSQVEAGTINMNGGGEIRNDGTLIVAQAMTVAGPSSWGTDSSDDQASATGVDMVGRLVNTGTFEVGSDANADNTLTINGHLMNEAGGSVTVHGTLTLANTAVAEGQLSDDWTLPELYKARLENTGTLTADDIIYNSGVFTNEGGTIHFKDEFDVNADFVNAGTIAGQGQFSTLNVSGATFANTSGASLEILRASVSNGGVLNLEGGSVTINALYVGDDQDEGHLYVGDALAEHADPDVVHLEVRERGELHLNGAFTAGVIQNDGIIDAAVYGQEDAQGSGSLTASTMTNNGTMRVDEASFFNYRDSMDATADFRDLTFAYGVVAGRLEATNFTLTGSLDVGGTATLADGERNVRVRTQATVETGAVLSIGNHSFGDEGFGDDGTTGSMRVVGQNGTETIDGFLTINGIGTGPNQQGYVNVYGNGTLYAEGLHVNGGVLNVAGNGVSTDYLSGTAGGTVNIEAGSVMHVTAFGDTSGMIFNFNGDGAQIEHKSGFYNNAVINLNGRDWTLAGSDDGVGFGVNTVNVNNESVVSYTENAVLKNNTTLVVNNGGVVNAGQIAFEDRYTGGLTINEGGKLVTALGQIFSSVTDNGYIEGIDVDTGEIVQFEQSGIQSVGAVKDVLTGEHGITVNQGGILEFTDDDWTVNAVNSAASNLQAAFGTDFTQDSTLVFSGKQDSGSGAFGIADANNLTSGVVLSNTILDAGDKTSITFGEEGDVTVSTVGFQAIAGATSVNVDGSHLYLVGFEGDAATGELVSNDTNTGSVSVENAGTLTLGLGSHQTSGHLDSVTVSGEGSQLHVAQGGTFKVDTVMVDGGGLVVSGSLTVDSLDDDETTTTLVEENAKLSLTGSATFKGTATIDGALEVAGDLKAGMGNTSLLVNDAGSLSVGGSAKIDDFNNDGDANIVSGLTSKVLYNQGSISANGVTVNADIGGAFYNAAGAVISSQGEVTLKLAMGGHENAGTVEGTVVSIAVAEGEEAAGLSNSGTIRATQGDLTISQYDGAGRFANSGTLEAAGGVVISADMENTGSIKGAGFTASNVSLANAGTISASGDANLTGVTLSNTGTFEAGKLTLDNTAFVNDGTLTVSGLELMNASTLTNNKALTADHIMVGEKSVLAQSETGVVTAEGLTVVGDTFALDSGTWIVHDEGGVKFETADGSAVTQGTINVQNGREYVTADNTIEGLAYNVTRTLTFGSRRGIAQSLAAVSEAVAQALESNAGVLTVDSGITIGAAGAINLGAAAADEGPAQDAPDAGEDSSQTENPDTGIETASLLALNSLVMPLAEGDAGETPSAPVEEPTVKTDAFNVGAGTVTIFTGNSFGADGTSAAISAGVEGLSATIDKEARAVFTDISHSGTYTLLSGFDLSSNLDANGEWTGGWTGDMSEYAQVDNGSDLDWKVSTAYDAASGTLVADIIAADVRSVYNFAIPDIANAALAMDAETAAGADVAFLQAVINNQTLDVAQTERVVNSVSQIAASLGASASFMNDMSSLMDSVESRAGLLSSAGREAGLWVRIEGGKYKMDSLSMTGGLDAGYDSTTYGVTLGADAVTAGGLRVGAAFSYLNGSADSEGDVLSGENDYDTWGLQVYGAWDVTDNARLIGEIGYFHSSNELSQKINYADVRSASADVDNDAVTFGVRGEMRFDAGNAFTVVPHAGVRGVWMMNDDFTTQIDGRDAFRSDQDDAFVFQIPVGVAVEKFFRTQSGWSVKPFADVTVAAQFGDTEYDTTVTGIGTGVSQAVSADMAGNFIGRAAIGVKAEGETGALGASYGFTAGDAGRQDHAFMVNFSYKF